MIPDEPIQRIKVGIYKGNKGRKEVQPDPGGHDKPAVTSTYLIYGLFTVRSVPLLLYTSNFFMVK